MSFIQNVRDGLKIHNITIGELCEKIGIAYSTFRKWEKRGILDKIYEVKISRAYQELCGEEVKSWR